MPEFGPVLGKGDAMWRALSVARAATSSSTSTPTRATSRRTSRSGLLGPADLRAGRAVREGLLPAALHAPDGSEQPADGGRVTELTARPLLSAFFPELAAFVQPLAGEVAARRALLERLPFATGYAVETAMLLHARDALGGTDGMAQVDLDVRLNSHQPLRAARPDGVRGAARGARAASRRGPPARRPRAPAPDGRRRPRAGGARRAAAVRQLGARA